MRMTGALLFGTTITFAALTGCSSNNDESSGSACSAQIASTYTMTGALEQQSAGCNLSGTPQTTVTVTQASGGYSLEFTGLVGSCLATSTTACGVQAKCNTNAGTLQFAWTFNATGFTGTNVGAINSTNCTYTAAATGERL